MRTMLPRKLLLMIVMVLFPSVTSKSCTEDSFQCANGKECVLKVFVCDGNPSCFDGSDEDSELCETWSYEYEDYYEEEEEDEGGGGAWFGGWGGGGDDNEEDATSGSEYEESFSEGEDDDQAVTDESDYLIPESVEESFEAETVVQWCSQQECIPRGPVNFLDGNQYNYRYVTDSRTEAIHGGSNQTSSMVISCDVSIKVMTACEMELELKNVALRCSNPDTSEPLLMTNDDLGFLADLEKQSLRFSMLGGEVDTICPSSYDENSRALNFKKGILSLFQNTMPQLHLSHLQVEKDIVGECEMEYHFEGADGVQVVVSKSKNLDSCRSRSYFSSSAQGVAYDFSPAINPLQIVTSKSHCRQAIQNGMMRDISCKETHVLTPFNINQGRIQTTITQELAYVEEEFFLSSPKSPFNTRTDLLFDHQVSLQREDLVKDTTDKLGGANRILNAANDMQNIQFSGLEDGNNSPSRIFKHLVRALREFSLEEFETLAETRSWGEVDRRYFYDAIPMTETSMAIQFIAQELPDQLVSNPETVSSWITTLAFIQKPEIDHILAISQLLNIENAPPEVFLSAGTLLNTYCLSHPSCEMHESVQRAMGIFLQVLNEVNCKTDNYNKKLKTMMALRGLGNAGLAADETITAAINSCILDKEAEAEVRATAIETFRRIPCNISRNALSETLRDQFEDAEVRMMAYLGLMRCPNYQIVRLIDELFEKEEVNQVGSFIWTHLTNLQETNIPSKIEIQSLLSNRKFEEKFKSDFRKYSKNSEISAFYDAMNIGGSLESNIIFSQKSFVPRQTTLNLTADLFGRSFNFFEAGIRLQGFEKSIENLMRGGVEDVDPSNIRSKDLQQKMTQAWAAVHHGTEPEVSFHMSAFGNDFMYQHLNNIEQIAEKFKRFNVQNIMKDLQQGQEFTFEKSVIPLDSSYTSATSTGLPLHIKVEGSVATTVSASLQMDVSALMRGKGMIQGHLQPSVSVNLRAAMYIDGYSAKTGIELDSSLDSSTAFDGKIEVDHKNAVKIDLGLPVDKMEIFKTSSKIMLIHGHSLEYASGTDEGSLNREDIYDPVIPRSESSDCLSYGDMLGIELCWSTSHSNLPLSFLNPQVLLKGPVKFSTTLTKMDPTLTTYKFRYEWANTDEKLLFHLLYDTPGSRVNRKTSFIFEVVYAMSNIRVILNTLISSVEIKGNYIFEDHIKRLNASLDFNSEHLASMDVGYKIHERRGERIVIPSLQIYWKNVRLIKIEGDLETRMRDPGKSEWDYGVNLELEIDLTGTDTGEKRGRGSIGGFIKRKNFDWEANLDAMYSFVGSQAKEYVNIYYKKVMHTSDSVIKEVRSWEVSFTQFPHLNTKGEWASKRFPGSIEDSVKASLGSNYKNPMHTVDFYRNFIFFVGLDQTTFNATVALKYPLKNLDIAIGGDLFHSNRHINAGLFFKYSTDQSIRSKFHIFRNMNPDSSIEGEFLFVVPDWLNLQMKAQVKQTAANTFEFEFDGSLSRSNRLEIAGHYRDLSTKLKQLHHVEMRVKIPHRDIIFSNSTFLYDPEQIVVASQIITKNGSKYKIRVAHIIPRMGTFSTQERQMEVDLSLPGRYYYWHSSITFDHYLTISNDIHLDSFRDINLLIKIRNGQLNEPISVEAVFKWDVNRDPHKIANFEMSLYERSIDLSSSISLFGNKYKGTWKSSKDWSVDENRLKFWRHFHSGELSWLDDRRNEHKIAFGASFNLTRNNGAEFTADAYLKTPVEEWRDNSVHLQYARLASKIVTVLKSNWHRDESLSLIFNLGTQKIDDVLKGQCLVEILSFINAKTVTFSTGAIFTQNKTDVDGRVFLEWDEDTVELILGGKNRSGPREIRGSILAKLFTTLPGYKRLSGSIDFYGSSTAAEILATTKWEDDVYKLKFSGDMYTSKEYLMGEIRLTTPQFGPDTALAMIRVYHDSETHEEKLMVIGQWLNQKVTLNGRVLVEPENFWASIDLNTPFAKLNQASLSLGHSTKDFYMTQVWCRWNTTNDLGIKLISKVISLRDFVFSASLKTPFPKYKEISAELRNLFKLTPSVQVNSRIFGQLDKRKFGLGGRYEQGKSPKLRVGLEMYYPMPGLQEVKFDIADNSSSTNMRYNFELRHGEERQIIIRTDFMRGRKSMAFSLDSTSTLASLLGSEFKKITLEGVTNVSWAAGTDFDIRLTARTMSDTIKVFGKGSIMEGKSGILEANLALPISNWRDLAIKLEYELPDYESSGIVDMYVISSGSPIFTLDLKGGLREGYLSFTAPLESPFNQGNLRFKLIPQDIVKSLATGTISLGGSQFYFDGYVFLENNYITKAKLSTMTPFEGFQNTTLTIEGQVNPEGGSKTVFQLKGRSSYFEGEIFHQIEAEKKWLLSVKTGLKLEEEEKKSFEGNISYENLRGNPVDFDLNLKIPEIEAISLSILIQSEKSPYKLKVEWDILDTPGSFEVTLDNFENERIRGSVQLTLKESLGRRGGVHKLNLDLHNRSTLDAVDLSLFIEIISTHSQWDYIMVDGHLKQVTQEPGILSVYLIWPEMNPVNFTAMARYSGEPIFDLKTHVHLNLTTANYGFLGEVKNVLPNLIVNGALWWRKDLSLEVENIRMESNFEFIGKDIEGTMSLRLPMMKKYELTVANVSYRQVQDFKKLRVIVNAGDTRTTYTSFRKYREFPAAQGNVTISSSLFREGHPIIVNFDQALTSDGFIGEYHLEGPVLNRTSNTYDTLSVNAKLNHTNLASGQEGILQLIIPQMNGVPISIIYSFQFPKKPDVIIKLGVMYKRIKFEVKGSHVLKTRANQRIKQTSIEIDNLIWPFGVTYEETTSLLGTDAPKIGKYSGDLQVNDRIVIYDLQNKDRRYSVSLNRKGNNDGGRISLNGLLGERQMEISAGYISLPHHLGGDIVISRFKGERIELQLDWKDDQETLERLNKRRHSITARFAHPLRVVLLSTTYGTLLDQHFINLNFSSNHQNLHDVPLRATWIYKNPNLGREKDVQLLMTISHPSLETDIFMQGDYKKNNTHPIFMNLFVKYSPEIEKNVLVTALVERDDSNPGLMNLFEIKHEKSKLHAKSSGKMRVEAIGYFFDQDLSYVTPNGDNHAVRMDGGLNLEEKLLYALIESSERIFDLSVKLENEIQNHWEITANSETINFFPIKTSFDLNLDQSVFFLKMESLRNRSSDEEATIFHDMDYPRYSANKVTLDGGLEDQRFAHFSIRHSSPPRESWIQDVDFAFKLNNSKLVFSHFQWRKRMEKEIKNEISELIGVTREFRASVQEWLRSVAITFGKEAARRSRPISKDFVEAIKPLILHIKNETMTIKNEFYSLMKNTNMTRKEKDYQASVQYALKNIAVTFSRLGFVTKLRAALARGTLGNQIKAFIMKVKDVMLNTFKKDSSFIEYIETLKSLASSFATAYDNAAKKMYLLFRDTVNDLRIRLTKWLRDKWHGLYYSYKPHIFRTVHHIELATYSIVSRLWEIMNRLGANLKSSSYMQTLKEIYRSLKYVYDEMSSRSLRQNVEWIYRYTMKYIRNGVNTFVIKILPFTKDWLEEVQRAWQKFTSYEPIASAVAFCSNILQMVYWGLSKIDFSEYIIDSSAFILENGYQIVSQKATTSQRNGLMAKTELIWLPKDGNIRLVQKLPFVWNSFNQKPDLTEFFEIPYISRLIFPLIFSFKKLSVLDSWYRYFNFNYEPSTWIPPFEATAYLVGDDNILTFDGRHLQYATTCEHLLAADLPHRRWAITIQDNKYTPKIIKVYIDGKIVEFSKSFKVKLDGNFVSLPHMLKSAFIWRTDGSVHITRRDKMEMSWNPIHDVVAIKLPREAFMSTAGLLGTNNNEPNDDLLMADGSQFLGDDLSIFFRSWRVDGKCPSDIFATTLVEPGTSPLCEELFLSKGSPFRYCFYQTDPELYYNMCLNTYKGKFRDTSGVALAYRERCKENAVPIKLPAYYVSCSYTDYQRNTKIIEEGQAVVLEQSQVPNIVDVVVLVELQSCNKEKMQAKSFHSFLTLFSDGMKKEGVASARFALVAYGGNGNSWDPHIVSFETEIFSSGRNIAKLTENLNFARSDDLQIESPGAVAFKAITFASNLPYRATGTLVLLLFPCSPCPEAYGLDYSTMYHILFNNAATLYVFKDDYFDIAKSSVKKKIVGFDKDKALVLKDHKKRKMGDPALKKQIMLPKSQLNLCLPLAIETKGAVFSSAFLMSSKKRSERMALVAGRRAGQNTVKNYDQRCLCLSTQDVTPLLRCDPWDNGDFTVLERYGLDIGDDQFLRSDVPEEQKEGFYQRK